MGDLDFFSKRLKKLRTSFNMTQKEFAEYTGCTAATLSAYENGSKNPSLEIVRNIAYKCKVSIDWLCGLSDSKYNKDNLTTYANIIRCLVNIEKKIKLTCDSSRILIYNKKLNKFLGAWKGMLSLHSNGTIDDNLYDLWIKQQIDIYDFEILSRDGKDEIDNKVNEEKMEEKELKLYQLMDELDIDMDTAELMLEDEESEDN